MYASTSFSYRFRHKRLKEFFYSDIVNAPTVGIDRVTAEAFEANMVENLKTISKKVLNGKYRFTNYRQKLLLKGANKPPRVISVPTIRDKVVIKTLSRMLEDVYGKECKPDQPQAVVQLIISRLSENTFDSYIKIDIHHFYQSIDQDRLLCFLGKKIKKKEILSLIGRAIKTPTVPIGSSQKKRRESGIPEGLSISNQLANLYLSQLDTKMKGQQDFAYFRYVDDILILCKSENVERIKDETLAAINELGLMVNNDKTTNAFISSDPIEYLGYVFAQSQITARQSSKQRFINSLERLVKKVVKHPEDKSLCYRLNLRITGCNVSNGKGQFHRYGWLQYFSRINDLAYLGQVDWLVRKFFSRNESAPPADLKSLRKTYYELNYNWRTSSYIPAFRTSPSPSECRAFLENALGKAVSDDTSDAELIHMYRKQIRLLTSELERDIGALS